MARTTVRWLGASLPRANEEGYAASTLPLTSLLLPEHRPLGTRPGIPTVVFFFSALDDAKLGKFEEQVFGSERVGVSSRFFNFIRISLDSMRSRDDRERYASKGVSIHLLDAKGESQEILAGWGVSGNNVYRALERAILVHSKQKLGAIVSAEAKILATLDDTYGRLLDLKAELTEIQAHLAEHDCQRGRRLVKELSAEITKVESERADALEREKKLLGPLGG